MSDGEETKKETQPVRNVLLAVGVIAGVAGATTGAVLIQKKPSPVAIVQVGEPIIVPSEKCMKLPLSERVRMGSCQLDENGKNWWVTCFGKFVVPKCPQKETK